jgi:hypothetical protein
MMRLCCTREKVSDIFFLLGHSSPVLTGLHNSSTLQLAVIQIKKRRKVLFNFLKGASTLSVADFF